MKNVGKFALILGIIFIVSGVASSLLFFASFDWNNFDNSDYLGQVINSTVIDSQNINQIKLDFTAEDIVIEKIEGSQFMFNLSGYYPESGSGEYPELRISNNKGNVYVNVNYPQKRYIFGINSRDAKLYVGVPENYNGDFYIEDVSGEVLVKNVGLSNFYLNTISGDIKIYDSQFHDGNLDCVSGDIYFENTSGINYAKSVSGNIKGLNFCAEANSKFESISGDVNINLIGSCSIDLDFESVSGNLKNNFGEIYYGENKIYVDTTSGNLVINRL